MDSEGAANQRAKLKPYLRTIWAMAYVDGRAFHVYSAFPVPDRMVSWMKA